MGKPWLIVFSATTARTPYATPALTTLLKQPNATMDNIGNQKTAVKGLSAMCAVFPKNPRIKNKKIISEMRTSYCEYCGRYGETEIHHLASRGASGGDIRENLINLCRLHHRKAHSGQIPRDELFSIVAKRENKTEEQIIAVINAARGRNISC